MAGPPKFTKEDILALRFHQDHQWDFELDGVEETAAEYLNKVVVSVRENLALNLLTCIFAETQEQRTRQMLIFLMATPGFNINMHFVDEDNNPTGKTSFLNGKIIFQEANYSSEGRHIVTHTVFFQFVDMYHVPEGTRKEIQN